MIKIQKKKSKIKVLDIYILIILKFKKKYI